MEYILFPIKLRARERLLILFLLKELRIFLILDKIKILIKNLNFFSLIQLKTKIINLNFLIIFRFLAKRKNN